MKMIYGVKDKPPAGRLILFALQQLLAILAATITVPIAVNGITGAQPDKFLPANLSTSAALVGAGIGTLVYLLFTRFRSPVFLGSSFAFIESMAAAFAGGVSMSLGYLGLIIGAVFAGLVYVVISLAVKIAGTKWIDKIMPAVVIGPTVAIIGLSLSGSAVGNLMQGGMAVEFSPYAALACGLVALGVTIVCSVYGKKTLKMIPFIIGILSGYALAAILTGIGHAANVDAIKLIDFSAFKNMKWYPDFAFVEIFKGKFTADIGIGAYIGAIAVAYVPVAFVVFAEHLADHKNISSIIEHDLLKDPGLHKTLLGDGIGSVAGALFGGCPNTTYGESVGCVAISGNASVRTIFVTALMAVVVAFIAPFVTFLSTIPPCVMGGVCVALYGFIAVSGLKMVQKVNLNDNRNLFTVSVILVAGVGGLALTFGKVTITNVACALILGILTNLLVNIGNKNKAVKEDNAEGSAEVQAQTEEIPAEQKAEMSADEAAATEETK